jgi:hypothetical protein
LNLAGLKEMRADYCLEQAVEAIEAMEVEDNMDLSSAESKHRYKRAKMRESMAFKGPDYTQIK